MKGIEENNFFAQKTVDINLDDFSDFENEAQVIHSESEIDKLDVDVEEDISKDEVAKVLDLGINSEEEVEDEPEQTPNSGGGAVFEALSSLIEEGVILPFDDEKDISEYSNDEVKELIKENFASMHQELSKSAQDELFKSLSPELQQALLYEMNGGTDRKAFFSALAAVEEMKNYDVSTEKGAEEVVRQYLLATNFGTPDEIEDEINDLKDRDRLTKRAEGLKPKLDSMRSEMVSKKVAAQSLEREKQAKQMQEYAKSIGEVLSKGELGGVKLDPSIQDKLYRGILEPSHTSVTGKRTNHFGHLLEKYQWVEPNHELILEAYMLLSDREAYMKSIREQIAKETNGDIRKVLKTSQEKKKSNASDLTSTPKDNVARRVIARPSNNIFKR